MIASVIVDVASKQINRVFEYLVPEHFVDTVKPGMRIIVPFGPRKVQGFVLAAKQHSDYDTEKLKPLEDIVDVKPALTGELLNLAAWLTDETLCLQITALKSMLPAAMRASYDKRVTLRSSAQELDRALQPFFMKEPAVMWEEIKKKEHALLPLVQKEVKRGVLDIESVVKSRETKKKVTVIEALLGREELLGKAESAMSRAPKQALVLRYLTDQTGPVPLARITGDTGVSRESVKAVVRNGWAEERKVEEYRDPYEGRSFRKTEPLSLMGQQKKSLAAITETLDEGKHRTFLLHGITGSGKTEVYLQAIDHALKQGKEAIVLVPEISLTPQMVHRFKERFGSNVAVLHSALSKGEKYDEWRKIRDGEVTVAVGARSAIFAPFENLGMIIIDEEHETSYKQEEEPRYHARDVAVKRGNTYKCPVVLGSATPSLESFARAKKGVYSLLEMDRRVNDVKLPGVEIVDMREELRSGNRSMFSGKLLDAMRERLGKKEQMVLFLNRRGYSTFIMCRDCGYVAECPHCDISLTYHRSTQTCQCHYCGYQITRPNRCPECESDHIRFFGSGTQRVEEELKKTLPEARVIRMDVDTTRKKGSHEKLLDAFGKGEGDILLGTQMIAKGLDFPNITLVGVLTADTMLHVPDFRSSEKTFQLLTQVSGRAGRHEKPGEVIVQSYTPEHFSIQLVKNHDYLSFFSREMLERKQSDYPPYYFLAIVNVSSEDLNRVITVSSKIGEFLRRSLGENTVVHGPAASAVPRIKDRYRYQCMVKYKIEPKLTGTLKEILKTYQTEMTRTDLAITIDTNPYMLM
ncbi:primosomal protein N' [Alteribacter natronophilus]|uniref:primosomal protein N' n=1 Tax=Alteribacter natronophilus TaxID=2583810 RepID=UPI00110E2880|nr:primosomal protein N' [Alteribacter natronophilus]TMW73166.1 primosomal protein N' [Alteribacter natronophilus]